MRLFKFKEIRGKKGIALIMALWIMTILLVVAASFAFMMRTEVKMAKNYRDGMKAHYLALAGVEHAIAVILNDTGNTDHYGEAWHTTFRTNWNESAVTWNALPISFGGGTYAVHLSDENSKYNLNYPSRSGLQYLVTTDHPPGDPPVSYRHKICGLKDYIDSGDGGDIQDWSPTDPDRGYEEGAGVKNNKFDTVYEIQKVRGKSSAWGYRINDGYVGEKIYDNPLDTLLDASGNKRRGDQSDMTVYSQDKNTQGGGSSRTEIKGASQATFDGLDFTSEEAYSIAAVSGTFADHSYPWYGDPPITEGVGAPGWATATLQTEISAASMIKAADKMTAGNYGGDNIIEATVNINTATLYGIQTLYNIEDVKGQAIIDTRRDARNCKGPDGLTDTEAGQWYTDARLSTIPLPPYTGDARGSPPYFANRGEIMMVYGVDKGIFQDCGDFVTVRSDRFRIYSTGTVGGAIRKIEAVVDRDFHDDGTMGPITVLYWSEKVFAD